MKNENWFSIESYCNSWTMKFEDIYAMSVIHSGKELINATKR